MGKFRTVIVILIKILLILALVVTFNLVMMPKYINENQDGRIIAEMYREKVSPDIIFLGSSTVYSGIVPAALYEEYGYASYICATSSQTSWNSYCILIEALKHFKPEMVVFDIGFLTTEEGYVEEVSNRKAYDYMRNGRNKYNGLRVAMDGSESLWSYLFPALRYHTRYKDLELDDFKYAIYKPDVTYNGYVMNKNKSTEIPDPLPIELYEDFRMDSINVEFLAKIITLCNENNIKLMLIKTPSYQAKWGVSYENDVQSIASANDVLYVNFDTYSDMMGIDWLNDSPDEGRHLNVYGAEKFTHYLGNIISDYYGITDRRNDVKYVNIWNDKVNRFRQSINTK